MVKMIKINESFICENCGFHNPKANKTCRNHCLKCLYSKHLDLNKPGDRDSKCFGLMEPLSIQYNTQKGQMVIHQCLKCHKQQPNKILEDDNQEIILNIMKKISQNL